MTEISADRTVRPPRQHEVAITVDGNVVCITPHTTAGDILRAVGLNPDRRRLVKVHGRKQTPYAATEKLTVHAGDVFITVSLGPTPVS